MRFLCATELPQQKISHCSNGRVVTENILYLVASFDLYANFRLPTPWEVFMKMIFSIVLVISTLITSCSNDSGSSTPAPNNVTDPNGNIISTNGLCSQSMIDAHNNTLNSTTLTDLKINCDKFTSMIGENSCQAIEKNSQNPYTLNSKSLSNLCAQIPVPKKENEVPKTSISETCSNGVVGEIRNFIAAYDAYSISSDKADLSKIVSSCSKLKGLFGSSKCSVSNNEYQYDMFSETCNSADKALIELDTPETPPAGLVLDNTLLVSKSLLVLIPKNTARLNSSFKNSSLVYFSGGAKLEKGDEPGPTCELITPPNFKGFSEKQKIPFSDFKHNSGNLSGETRFSSQLIGLEFRCYNFSETVKDQNYKMTLAEFAAALGNWFSIVRAE